MPWFGIRLGGGCASKRCSSLEVDARVVSGLPQDIGLYYPLGKRSVNFPKELDLLQQNKKDMTNLERPPRYSKYKILTACTDDYGQHLKLTDISKWPQNKTIIFRSRRHHSNRLTMYGDR